MAISKQFSFACAPGILYAATYEVVTSHTETAPYAPQISWDHTRLLATASISAFVVELFCLASSFGSALAVSVDGSGPIWALTPNRAIETKVERIASAIRQRLGSNA